MDRFSLDKIEVLVIEPERSVRTLIVQTLKNAGVRNIKEGSGLKDIMHFFQISMPDMIISDINLPDGNFNTFVYKLRHHDIGSNPFLPILALVDAPTANDIRAVVQAGADDLITKPISATQLMQRIKTMIISRKPFMVTSAYIGPDRRKPEEKAAQTHIKSMEVPNILKAKAVNADRFDEDQLQKDIRASINMVNLQKLGSHANQTKALVEKIVPSLAFGSPDEPTTKALERLLYVSEDISRRMVGTKFGHVSELCQSMLEVTRRILAARDFPDHKDVDLLKPLSIAISRGFDETDTEVARLAHQISTSISIKD
ncbi:MAG: hypothetical protein COB46_10475 [Rhodospirillaceae bacterium]|nr:MAG: hypothetical protein COB46_10475 [Rhodospirillaceae bacterium]